MNKGMLLISFLAVVILMTGCSYVNKERAVQFYEQSVQHFPEEILP